jgi:hypothetical protein
MLESVPIMMLSSRSIFFYLFPKLKTLLSGHRLLDAVKIQGRAATILNSIAERFPAVF